MLIDLVSDAHEKVFLSVRFQTKLKVPWNSPIVMATTEKITVFLAQNPENGGENRNRM
jgi:hypothetical protein